MPYTRVARWLHWGTAALILASVTLGLTMVWVAPLPDATKFALYALHENIGLTLLALTLVRLAWRRGHPPPPLEPGLSRWQALAAHGTHAALYGLLLAMPVLGFLASNAWGFPVRLWYLVTLPDPIGRSERWAPLLSAAHDTLGFVLIGLVALHAAAALWHHFGRRDGTLRRMMGAT